MPERPTAAEEQDLKELCREMFGEGEEPISWNQYLAIKCIIDERDNLESQLTARDAECERLRADKAELLDKIFQMYHAAGMIEGGDELEAVKRLKAELVSLQSRPALSDPHGYHKRQAAEYRSHANDMAARCGPACTREWSDMAEGWRRLAEAWERDVADLSPALTEENLWVVREVLVRSKDLFDIGGHYEAAPMYSPESHKRLMEQKAINEQIDTALSIISPRVEGGGA